VSDIQTIIADLEKLSLTDSIDVAGFFDFTQDFSYEPIKHYLESLKNQTKPETAASELFRKVVEDVLKIKSFSEVNIGSGFIDFALKESVGNPILIELKPFFRLVKNGTQLKIEELDYTHHQAQILKYLKHNEYVILTNLSTAFIFSRNAIIEFEPFQTLNFTDLLKRFLQYENLWDTIKRIEDQNIKVDLDKSFFEDLKNWYNEFKKIKFIENDKFTKEEIIVLLLNKIIFIKTLEDFGLVQFKHLADEYYNKKDKWEAKGSERILTTFFNELEEYFDYFYDTELFKTKFWDFIDKDKKNLEDFQHVFETALGLDAWHSAFGRGMLHYNYRQIDEDIFGKAYETFIAENKKDSGVYYTPKEITQYMAKKLVDYLFNDKVDKILIAVDKDNPNYDRADELLYELYEIKIVDPASGSGSFLIKVLREIYNYYKKIDDATLWVNKISTENLFDMPAMYQATNEFRAKHNFKDHLQLISKIILRHIHAVDIDERALETAKTNIWKEAIKLNPRIYNYKKLNGKSSHILPNLELNFVCADSLADLEIEEQLQWLSENHKDDIKRLFEIRENYLANLFEPKYIDEALKIREDIYSKIKEKLPEIVNPLFVCLRYFFIYFDKNGKPLKQTEQGFDGVISNPPWETIKPIEKEFARKGKYGLNIIDFKKWFSNELLSNKIFSNGWENYKDFYKRYNAFLSNRFKYQGIGDPNYYKLFIERGLELLKELGEINILIPSGIQTDIGCTDLRRLIIEDHSLNEISSFENKGYDNVVSGKVIRTKLFPEVDPRFKFSVVNACKLPNKDSFEAKFYLHNPSELFEKENIPYTRKMIEKFSPKNLSIMEFRSITDYHICKKIRNEHILLGESDFYFTSEFHMTNDSHLFYQKKDIKSEKDSINYAPLFEGKMIHQFNSAFDVNRYFVHKNSVHKLLIESERNRIRRKFEIEDSIIKKLNIKLDYQDYRLAYRAVGSSTNERSIIASILPQNVFIGHSMNYLINYYYEKTKEGITQQQVSKDDLMVLLVLLNSLTLNYYIRNKISSNLTINFMYELPVPKINKKNKSILVEKGTLLLSSFNDKTLFSKLFKELKVDTKREIDPIQLRAELEVYIAKELYKLSKEDWQYITSTFVYGEKSETKQELDKFIAKSLEIF